MAQFPKDFLWSASTAATQIEGGWNADGRGESIWDTLVHDGTGRIAHSENADTAIDFYHRWREDVALMKEIGLTAYRFSISWPRILPEGTGRVNEAGVRFYQQLCDALLAAGIQPLVTLYHWDLPTALYRKGGWKNSEIVEWFAEYVEVISRALADQVSCWMTFNEPQMFCGLGMQAGVHAPFEHNDDAAMMSVTKNILLAHGRAVQILRKNCPQAKVGIAPTGDCCLPKDDSPEEVEKAHAKSLSAYPNVIMSNTWWADPIYLGQYPDWAADKFGDTLYPMTEAEWTLVSQPLDFYAYNCYQGTTDLMPDPAKYDDYASQGSPKTATQWNFTPKALYYSSKFWFERYHLPVLITENGYAGLDHIMLDGKGHDPQRIDFLHRYLLEVAHAINDGIPVLGYSVWSLFDNFEWAAGYDCRYGLIYVDYPTQRRVLKDSAHWYHDVIAANGANL